MPEAKRPLKVFLCHASADKPKVRELYRYLKKRGIQPWLDAEDLLPGQNWQVEIPKAIEESDAILICLSKASIDKEGYVQKEIRFALDKALELPEGRIFIIPVRLDECEVPRTLSNYHWVDLFEQDGYSRLMKSLKMRTSQLQRTAIELLKSDLDTFHSFQQPNVKQEVRIFYDLATHYDCDIENTNAETLAKFLLESLIRIMASVYSVDKNVGRSIEYRTDQVEYFDPKDGKTLQYVLLIHGKKLSLIGKGDLRSIESLTDVREMLIITVTPGINNTSRLRFDSDNLPNKPFRELVQRILWDIGKDMPDEASETYGE